MAEAHLGQSTRVGLSDGMERADFSFKKGYHDPSSMRDKGASNE